MAIIWGPQPGINPINDAIITAINPSPYNASSDSSMPENNMENSKIRYAVITQNVTNAVSLAEWINVSRIEYNLSPIDASVSSPIQFFCEIYRIIDKEVPIKPIQVINPCKVNGL